MLAVVAVAVIAVSLVIKFQESAQTRAIASARI